MGYIDYYDTKELQEKAKKENKSVTTEATDENKKIYEAYVENIAKVGNCINSKKAKNSMLFVKFQFTSVYLSSMLI